MLISYDHKQAKVEECTPAERVVLKDLLTVWVHNAQFTKAFEDKRWDGYRHFLSSWGTFPSGLIGVVKKHLTQEGYRVKLIREAPRHPPLRAVYDLSGIELYDFQKAAVFKALKTKRGILQGTTSCHAPGQKVRMLDGKLKRVEDIQRGDLLLGPDSKPREVLTLHHGKSALFKVEAIRGGGEMMVTPDHMLTLVHTSTGQTMDIPVIDYLTIFPKWRKHYWKGFLGGEVFYKATPQLDIDPYFLGLLLGDGCLRGGTLRITTPDQEIINSCYKFAQKYGTKIHIDDCEGRCPSFFFSNPPGVGNPLLSLLRKVGVYGKLAKDKYIPEKYLRASLPKRLGLLAGLLDTDGYYDKYLAKYEYLSASRILSNQVVSLAKSAGLYASCREKTVSGTKYYRVYISGDTHKIPCRVSRKIATKTRRRTDPLRSAIKISRRRNGEYFGFTLSGDGRYLLENHLVTHNSGKTECGIAIANSILRNPQRPMSGLWITHSRPLMWQTKERFEKRLPQLKVGVIGDGHYSPAQMTIAIPNSLNQKLKQPKTQKRVFEDWLGGQSLVVLDEAHLMNDMWRNPLARCYSALFKLALTATPLLKDDDSENFDLVGATGSVFYQITARDLIDRDLIAEPHIWFLEYDAGVEIPSRAHWSTIYAEGIVNCTPRNERICSVARDFGQKGIPTLILVEQINHGQIISSSLSEKLNQEINFVSGESSTESRQRAIQKLASGENPILVATTIFDAGIDIPAISAIILAGGKKSSIRTYQRIGRGMRKKEGKDIVKVFDFWDRHNSVLTKHSRQRYLDCEAEDGYVMEGRHWNGE